MNRPFTSRRLQLSAGAGVAIILGMAGQAAAQTRPADEQVSEVVVTGTRLTSGFTAPTPVSVLGVETIEQRAKVSVAEALFEMPAFRASRGMGQTGGANTVFTSLGLPDLRGLGFTRTLTLVDGHRRVGTIAEGAFDTNMIPPNLIERVDVVTGGASAAYGSDAVAGVVNFIMNRRLNGLRANAQYGISQHGDGEEVNFGVAGGTDFAGGRGHVVVGADYARGDESGNMFSRDWGRRQGGLLGLGANRPAGVPAFLITDNVQQIQAPGGLITSCVRGTLVVTPCALNGLTFNAAGQPTPFGFGSLVGAAAMYGGGNAGNILQKDVPLRAGYTRKAGMAMLTYKLTPELTLNADLSGGDFRVRTSSFSYSAPANFIRVNRDNPFLPAALASQMDAQGITQIRLSRLTTDIGGIRPRNFGHFYEGRLGLQGKVFGDWTWDADAVHGTSRYVYNTGNFVIVPNFAAAAYAVRAPDGSIVCGPAATNPMLATLTPAQRSVVRAGCIPYNPFGSANTVTEAQRAYLTDTTVQDVRNKRTTFTINLTGSPFSLPAGEVSLATGYEFRHDSLDVRVPDSIAAISAANAFWATNFLPAKGSVEVNEVYAEVGAPVLKDLAFAKSLDLNGAVRYTHYSSSGDVVTWKVGGTYDVNDWLRLRATRSRDIRAPNPNENFVTGVLSLGSISNPVNGVTDFGQTQSTPNPDLKPEKANTFTIGMVIQPTGSFLDGLRVSADYFTIKTKDVISSLSAPDVLRGCYLEGNATLCSAITPASNALGFSRIELQVLNLNSDQMKGWDFEVSYRVPMDAMNLPGRLLFSALGTWTRDLQAYDRNGRSLGQRAGIVFGIPAGVPKWRWNINLDYDLGRFGANLSVRTNSSMKYRVDLLEPGDPGYNPAAPNSINDNTFPRAAYTSVSASYKLGAKEEWTVFGVIDNLMNTDPPTGSWLIFSWANPYESFGRSFKVGARARF